MSRNSSFSCIYSSMVFGNSGDHDFMVPFISTQSWIRSLNHSIVDDWRPWMVEGQVGGYAPDLKRKLYLTPLVWLSFALRLVWKTKLWYCYHIALDIPEHIPIGWRLRLLRWRETPCLRFKLNCPFKFEVEAWVDSNFFFFLTFIYFAPYDF